MRKATLANLLRYGAILFAATDAVRAWQGGSPWGYAWAAVWLTISVRLGVRSDEHAAADKKKAAGE